MCIKKAAVESKKTSICSGIGGFLERSDCISAVGRQDTPIQETFSKPVINQASLNATATPAVAPARTLSTIFSDILSSLTRANDAARANPDSTYTADGFFQRLAVREGVTLYAFSEYQVAPGTTITAQGVGFTKTGNTVHIGDTSVSGIESADGTILTFTVPGMNDGQYEGWIENAKGSSRKTTQKVYLMVTDSPAPHPVITRVSPSMPAAEDTLTFYGENLGSSIMVISTLGVKEGISANGGSFSLRLSDLPYFSKMKNAKGMQGMKASFFIHVQNENGVTRQPFSFDVQF